MRNASLQRVACKQTPAEITLRPARSLSYFQLQEFHNIQSSSRRAGKLRPHGRGGVKAQLLATSWNPLRQGHRPGWHGSRSTRMWVWPTATALSAGTTGMICHNKASSSDDSEPSRTPTLEMESKDQFGFTNKRFLEPLQTSRGEANEGGVGLPVRGRLNLSCLTE